MLKLYTARNSICTQKVLITLDEKSIEHDTENVNLFTNEQYNPNYVKLNPKGVVPTLLHDGRPIVESTLICEYLDDVFPSRPLVPKDPYLRAQMRLWSKLVDEQIFEATREISFSAHFRYKMRAMTPEQREIRYRNVADPERRARFMSTFEHGTESPYAFWAIAHFAKAFKAMDKALAAGGPWLLGQAYTLADVNMIPFVARMHYLDLLDIWIVETPRVASWWERAKLRPSTDAAIEHRLTADELDEMKRYGSGIRDAVRQKRAEYLNLFPDAACQ